MVTLSAFKFFQSESSQANTLQQVLVENYNAHNSFAFSRTYPQTKVFCCSRKRRYDRHDGMIENEFNASNATHGKPMSGMPDTVDMFVHLPNLAQSAHIRVNLAHRPNPAHRPNLAHRTNIVTGFRYDTKTLIPESECISVWFKGKRTPSSGNFSLTPNVFSK